MRAFMTKSTHNLFAIALGGAVLVTTPVPAQAQELTESRLRKIEAEIRALQRNVFPGGDGRYFEPQISTDGAGSPQRTSLPSTTAVTDILARLDALELQMQRLTALSEENTNALSQMEIRLAALEETAAVAGSEASAADTSPPLADPFEPDSANTPTPDQLSGLNSSEPTTATPITGPSDERLAGVQAITKPQSDDAGDDEYSYGFRLWNAGYFPEARQQLVSFVEGYPSHWRLTYGRNLLGRAFLDDGLPEEAARWFLRNYQADRQAARAPDSLLYLAEAMIALDDTSRACIALAEFADTYPAVASGRLSDQYEANRQKITCSQT